MRKLTHISKGKSNKLKCKWRSIAVRSEHKQKMMDDEES